MVSYTRARAEALGVECKVGIATRPVRVVILSVGLLFAEGELIADVDLLPGLDLRDRGADRVHDRAARLACARRAEAARLGLNQLFGPPSPV